MKRDALVERYIELPHFDKIDSFELKKSDCRSVFRRNCFNICNEFNVTSPDKVDLTDISMPIKMLDIESRRIPFILDIINSIGNEADLNLERSKSENDIIFFFFGGKYLNSLQ